jgi:hypothetical protein
MQVLQDLMLNILATLIGIFLIYFLFKPWIRIGYRVKARLSADGRPIYNCSYRNAGLFKVYDIRVDVTLRYLAGPPGQRVWQLVPIPVDDRVVPVLGRRKGKKYQLPKLLLDDVEWNRHPLPIPVGPVDLEELLTSLEATLYLHIACTANISQVGKVYRKEYGPTDVQVLPARQ